MFLHDNSQKGDGSFKYDPGKKLLRGVKQPGKIQLYHVSGEISSMYRFVVQRYEDVDFEGAVGFDDVGNRGTQFGLNK